MDKDGGSLDDGGGYGGFIAVAVGVAGSHGHGVGYGDGGVGDHGSMMDHWRMMDHGSVDGGNERSSLHEGVRGDYGGGVDGSDHWSGLHHGRAVCVLVASGHGHGVGYGYWSNRDCGHMRYAGSSVGAGDQNGEYDELFHDDCRGPFGCLLNLQHL